MVRSILVIVSLACFAPSLLASDWPQWRGPRSNGVGEVSRAPDRWSPTQGVSWRAEIEGTGMSSPVIAGNRVYVTTAIPEQRRSTVRLVCDYLIGGLAVLGVPALVRYRLRLRPPASHAGRGLISRVVEAMDLAIFVLLACGVVVFGTLMAMGPQALDSGLNAARDAGVELARWLGRHQTNLSFLEWDEGTRHNTWIISSAMALVSLALIPFLFVRSPAIRVGVAAALFAGVALAKTYVPWGEAYGSSYPTGALIVLYSPVVALAAWHVVQSLVSRIRTAGAGGHTMAAGSRPVGGMPVVLSLAMFVSPNYLYQPDMLTRRLVCLDAATGKRVWQTDAFTTLPEATSGLNSHATPTPSVVNDTIVAAFGPGVAAFDLEGEVLWSKTFPKWIENSIYGAGSSPVTDGRAVFVTDDREFEAKKDSRVIAYSLETGDELWSHSPSFAVDGYATPVLHDDGGRTLLITLTARTLVAYDIASGAIAWQLHTPVAQPIPSVIVEGGRLYVTGGKGEGYTAAYELRRHAPPEELWRSQQSPADVSSPVLYKGRLFTITSTGIMVCYDAASGRMIWRRRVGSGGLGVFYASLVAADDKIYAARSNGTTYVIAAADEFRLISESSLPEEAFATPAFAANCLFLRTASAVYCIADSD